MERILKQAARGLIELLSEESKNVVHSIETELESLLHANFPADLVTERNSLEKDGEKTKQILEERRNTNGINKTAELELWNILIASNLLIFQTEKKGNLREAPMIVDRK